MKRPPTLAVSEQRYRTCNSSSGRGGAARQGRFANRFVNNFNSALAIIGDGHFIGAWTAEPEVFYPVRGFRLCWVQHVKFRLRRLNHKDLAFAQINQRSRTRRVSALSEHNSLLCRNIGPPGYFWRLFVVRVDAGTRLMVRCKVFFFALPAILENYKTG
jgi:hypothetical protein